MATAVAEDDALWAAVADPTRRRVLDALLEHGEATTTTLAEELPVTRQAVAKHLVASDGNRYWPHVDYQRQNGEQLSLWLHSRGFHATG